MLHICCCHDDVLTEERLRKRRFSNKYHDVQNHTAHALSGMLSYLDFRGQAKNDPSHYLWTHIFSSSREKISVYKNIRIRVDESLAGMRNCAIPSDLMLPNAFIISPFTPVSGLAKEEVFTIAHAIATAETSLSIM